MADRRYDWTSTPDEDNTIELSLDGVAFVGLSGGNDRGMGVASPRLDQVSGSSSFLPEEEHTEAGGNGGQSKVTDASNSTRNAGGNGGKSEIIDASNSRSFADPASQCRIRRRLQYGGGNKLRNIKFPAWLCSSVDILTEILGRLPPDKMIQVATVSKDFKEIIISDGFRSHVRCHVNQKRYLLGLFPKRRNMKERYPFVQCGSLTYLPRPVQAASFWVKLSWKPNSYWTEIELLDSRDGKVLLLAGNTNRSREFVIFYPQLRTNPYRQLPRLTLLDESNIRLVSAALIPDDKSHQFRVIVLSRRGEADTKIKPEALAAETSVVCFTSSTGKWENPVTTWFEAPTKNMLGLGSVLVENKLCFLEKCRRVITVDITSLELGTIVLPKVKNIGSRTSHVLTRSTRSKMLCLAIVSQRCIAVYSHDGKDWDLNLLHPGPGHTKAVALKLIGSTDITGLILIKADGRVIYKMEADTGLFYQIDDNVPEEEALPLELEYPPVSQMLLKQKNAH